MKPSAPDHASASDVNQRLLDAAEAVFAEKGFDAAGIREITAQAGCNVAAINYHFGSKENLYREVFRRRLRHLRDLRIQAIDRVMHQGDPPPTLERLCSEFARVFLEPLVNREDNRALMHLFCRELHDGHLGRELLLNEIILPVQERFCRALQCLCPRMTKDEAILNVHCLASQLLHLTHITELMLNRHDLGLDDPRVDRAVEHIVRFSVAGMSAFCGDDHP